MTNDEVVINRGAANDGDLAIGDHTIVATPEPVDVEIVGIATFGGEDGLGPTTFTAFTLAGAEEHVTGQPGGVTALLVKADDGVSQDELVARIADVAPDGVEVISGADLVDEANDEINADFVGFLRIFLLVFAGVALLVATFSINNTFSIIAAQRQRSSALLRAIGADRRQVFWSLAGESIVVGVVASAVGLGLGFALAQGLKALFDAFGFALPAGGLTIRTTTLVIAPLVGILITLLASLAPAVRASRVAPLAALRDVAVDRSAVVAVASRRRLGDARRRCLPGRDRRVERRARRGRPRCVAHGRRCGRRRPGRRPPCQFGDRRPDRPVASHSGRPRPSQRHALPPAHGGDGVGADDRHRRRDRVHRFRRITQVVGRRQRRARSSTAI